MAKTKAKTVTNVEHLRKWRAEHRTETLHGALRQWLKRGAALAAKLDAEDEKRKAKR
jgi:hypothetical protein